MFALDMFSDYLQRVDMHYIAYIMANRYSDLAMSKLFIFQPSLGPRRQISS